MKKWELAVLTGLIMSIIISQFSAFAIVCEEVRNETLRLHVRANSNSVEDQELKYAVRDAILLYYGEKLSSSENLQHSIDVANNLKPAIEYTASQIVEQMGYDYEIDVEIKEEYFTVKEYDDYTLPAGIYNAVSIEIGQGIGENWFCVLYPALCIPAAAQDNEIQLFTKEQEEAISSEYEIKFALLELFEQY